MIVLHQSAELLRHTPDPELLIEQAGRVCYRSEEKTTDDSHVSFIRMVCKNQHESVLEHASATFLIVCDRGVSHEIVRHRIASYSQESTRYCNYGKSKFGGSVRFIEPPIADDDETDAWLRACELAEYAYLRMLERGVAPQIARSVLPTSLATSLVMTANFREWRHFLRLRLAPSAHPQIREVAALIAPQLVAIAPTVFEEFTNG